MIGTLKIKPVLRFLAIILFLSVEIVFLEFTPGPSREISPLYSGQDAGEFRTGINNSIQQRTLKQSPTIIHFPQSNHQQNSPLSSQWIPPLWFVTSPTNTLREPANIPTIIYQDDARYLEKYMKNHFEDGESAEQQSKLNLASINHRAPKSEIQQQAPSNQQAERRYDNRFNNNFHNTVPANSNSNQKLGQDIIRRPDILAEHRSDIRLSSMKEGNAYDVALFKPGQATKYYPPSPAKQFISSKLAHLDKLDRNCITKASPFTSRCEDHLIRRLHQDATEGRTVLDVGRRVCCALFWHKDCISGIVINNCADSSPAAAEYLMGSRKIDITLSCQRFNRDGCNSAPGRIGMSVSTSFILIFITLLIQRQILGKNKLFL